MNFSRVQSRATVIAVALLFLLLSSPTILPAQAVPPRDASYVQQIIALAGAGDVEVAAVLTHPAAGINPYAPGIVHVHGGPGGTPLGGAPRFAAERLAARGYTNISILLRHSRQYPWMAFEEGTADIKAAVDELANLGIRDIILSGHSMGSIQITKYMAATNDPRVHAMIHYAPTRDTAQWMREALGEEQYWKTVARASQAVQDGRGTEEMMETHFDRPPPAPKNAYWNVQQTAENWLRWWGPTAQMSNSILMAQLKVPQLMLAGDADLYVTRAYMGKLKAAMIHSPRVDTIWYTGGVDHMFDPIHDRVAADTAQWLETIGYGARPPVVTRLVDTKASDGRPTSAVLFTPAAGADLSKPVFVLLHGWADDVYGSQRWLGAGLAQRGYAALAISDRTAGLKNQESDQFEDITLDLKAWIDYLDKLGYHSIVGEGHSFGGIRFSYYATTAKDARLKGIVYLAPTRNAPEWLRDAIGQQKYDAVVAEAQEAVSQGKGNEHLIDLHIFMPPPAEAGKVPFEIVQYAKSFLSTWGPNAATEHIPRIAQIHLPTLSLAGSKDVFVSREYMEEFTKAAGGPAESVFYDGPDGADHMFDGYEQRVVDDIAKWAAKRFAAGSKARQTDTHDAAAAH